MPNRSDAVAIPQYDANNDMLYADSGAPLFYSPYFSHQHRFHVLDPFYKYRASSPAEINDLDESDSEGILGVGVEEVEQDAPRRRFSNRLYRNHESRMYSSYTPVLEAYLKPPTPPPTSLSFTPSYTTAVFPDSDDVNNQREELKSEATSSESLSLPLAHIKPISLMVEIFPATDYQLPASREYIVQFVNVLSTVCCEILLSARYNGRFVIFHILCRNSASYHDLVNVLEVQNEPTLYFLSLCIPILQKVQFS